jgi:hypothetical protein
MVDRRVLVRGVAVLLALPVLALLLVVAADLIPDRLVMSKMHTEILEGKLDDNSYSVGSTGGTVDGHSECKRMTIGLGAPAGMNDLESAIWSPTLGSCETAVPKIRGWADGDGLVRSYYYFRYWHGSAVVLRPSVAVLGVSGTRLVAAGVLAGAAIALALGLARRVGRSSAALFMAPLLLTTDYIDLPGALVHAIGMIVTVGGAAAILRYLRSDSSAGTYALVAFVLGGAFNFFADLTNPDAAWALVVAVSAIVAVGAGPIGSAVRRTSAAAAGWIIGFGWMWLSKWVVASFVVGYSTVRDVVRFQAEERLAGDTAGMGDSRLAGLHRAWDEWMNEPLIPVLVPLLLVAATAVVWRQRDLARTWQRRIVLGAPAVIPFVWHLVMRQHTFVHGWFTYRSVAVAFGIVLLAATARLSTTAPPDDEDEDHATGRTPGVIQAR